MVTAVTLSPIESQLTDTMAKLGQSKLYWKHMDNVKEY